MNNYSFEEAFEDSWDINIFETQNYVTTSIGKINSLGVFKISIKLIGKVLSLM
jgi:hypothetical protein